MNLSSRALARDLFLFPLARLNLQLSRGIQKPKDELQIRLSEAIQYYPTARHNLQLNRSTQKPKDELQIRLSEAIQ